MIETIIFIIFMCIFIGGITGQMFRVVPFIMLLVVALFFTFGIKILGVILAVLLKNPWLILVLLLAYYLRKKNAPKRSKNKFYYYSSSSSQQQQKDFEEFFKQTGGFNNNSGNYNGNWQNNSSFPYQGATEKDYENLGIRSGATKEEIKKAYRDKVKMHHPDRYSNATEQEKAYHETKIKEVNESYEKISKSIQ